MSLDDGLSRLRFLPSGPLQMKLASPIPHWPKPAALGLYLFKNPLESLSVSHPLVFLKTATTPPAPTPRPRTGDCDTDSLSHLQRNINVTAGGGCRAFLVIKEKVRGGAPFETVFL